LPKPICDSGTNSQQKDDYSRLNKEEIGGLLLLLLWSRILSWTAIRNNAALTELGVAGNGWGSGSRHIRRHQLIGFRCPRVTIAHFEVNEKDGLSLGRFQAAQKE
jgi:hypothetical protein